MTSSHTNRIQMTSKNLPAPSERLERPNSLLTEKEAAAYLSVSVRTLQDKRVRGGGPYFVKLFRSVRYRVTDLDAFIDAATRANTSEAR